MHVNFATLSRAKTYFQLTQNPSPRPIYGLKYKRAVLGSNFRRQTLVHVFAKKRTDDKNAAPRYLRF
jgi:hypothetical protein